MSIFGSPMPILRDADSTTGGVSAPADSGENWEARFKGLQRTYNDLKSEYDGIQKQIVKLEAERDGARANASDLQQRLNDLQTERKGDAQRYESEIAKLTADLETANSSLTETSSKVEALQDQIQLSERRNTVRGIIARDELGKHLTAYYEAGMMNELDQLEGEEAITERLQRYKEAIAGTMAEDFKTAMQNSTPSAPPNVSTNSATLPAEQNLDTLKNWLNNPANLDHPDYERVDDQYTKLVSKTAAKE